MAHQDLINNLKICSKCNYIFYESKQTHDNQICGVCAIKENTLNTLKNNFIASKTFWIVDGKISLKVPEHNYYSIMLNDKYYEKLYAVRDVSVEENDELFIYTEKPNISTLPAMIDIHQLLQAIDTHIKNNELIDDDGTFTISFQTWKTTFE